MMNYIIGIILIFMGILTIFILPQKVLTKTFIEQSTEFNRNGVNVTFKIPQEKQIERVNILYREMEE